MAVHIIIPEDIKHVFTTTSEKEWDACENGKSLLWLVDVLNLDFNKCSELWRWFELVTNDAEEKTYQYVLRQEVAIYNEDLSNWTSDSREEYHRIRKRA